MTNTNPGAPVRVALSLMIRGQLQQPECDASPRWTATKDRGAATFARNTPSTITSSERSSVHRRKSERPPYRSTATATEAGK